MAENILGNTTINGSLTFGSAATVSGFPAAGITNTAVAGNAAIARTKLAQETLVEFNVPFTSLRVWDNIAANLPNAAATDDLGLVNGTFASDAPRVNAGDLKAASSTTRRARFLAVVPAEYDDAETVNLRISAGMVTTVADVSCNLDAAAYLWDKVGGLNGSPTDLVTTAAQSMNSLTAANLDFVLTATNLVSGSVVDIQVTVTCDDAATGTAVIPSIFSIAMLYDIRG